MDDWGDPWAENRAEKSPAKEIAAASTDVKRASVLEDLGNEAHWGDGDAFGDLDGWSNQAGTGSGKEVVPPDDVDKAHSQAEVVEVGLKHVAAPDLTYGAPDLFESHVDNASYRPALPNGDSDESGTVHLTTQSDISLKDRTTTEGETVISATTLGSEPGFNTSVKTNIQDARSPTSSPQSPPTNAEIIDDDASTRPSTSPSDVNQLVHSASDSPRTSLEDGNAYSSTPRASLAQPSDIDSTTGELDQEDDFGDFEEQVQDENIKGENDDLGFATPELAVSEAPPISDGITETVIGTEDLQSPVMSYAGRPGPMFEIDTSLIDQLFPSTRPSVTQQDADEAIISTTSARKAWYQITRKQTLREHNKGEDDDHYVRVAWKGSAIQAQVNKTVSRWAAEDRIHGRVVLGGRPGAIFGWDESGDSRHVPSIKSESISGKPFATAATRSETATKHTPSMSKALGSPITKRTSIIDANPVAQFSWSSSPVTVGPTSVSLSERTSPDLSRKTPLSVSARSGTAPSPASALPHTDHHGRWASVDLPSTRAPSIKRHRASQSTSFPAAATAKASVAFKPNEMRYHQESALASKKLADGRPDPVTSISSITMDTSAGDDEWGEMVQSPVSPNPSGLSISEQQLSSPSLDFDRPGDAIAAFAELPTHTQVSIPDVSSTLTSSTSFEAPPVVQNPQYECVSFPNTDSTTLDPPLSYKHEIQKLPQSEPVLANTALPPRDPWSDVDFSIFETPAIPEVHAAPRSSASTYPDKYPPARRDPSLETKTRVSSPPTVHGSNTSMETENDRIVKRILQGLPDLGYMLR